MKNITDDSPKMEEVDEHDLSHVSDREITDDDISPRSPSPDNQKGEALKHRVKG